MTWPFTPRRLVICQHKVDYRKQWNGLLAESYRMGYDPYGGDCMVFLKRDRSQIRILAGDRLGLYILARRFDGGCLPAAWQFVDDPCVKEITASELKQMLDGISVVVRRVRPVNLGLSKPPDSD